MNNLEIVLLNIIKLDEINFDKKIYLIKVSKIY